jgi:hypothetical protein
MHAPRVVALLVTASATHVLLAEAVEVNAMHAHHVVALRLVTALLVPQPAASLEPASVMAVLRPLLP